MTDATSNPKHAAGVKKSPMHFLPPAPMYAVGRVMAHGAQKYGAFNWGKAGVVASIYYDAARRHLDAWYAGETIDPESGEPHLAHVMACCAIVEDCRLLGNLMDDRPVGMTAKPETGGTAPPPLFVSASLTATEIEALRKNSPPGTIIGVSRPPNHHMTATEACEAVKWTYREMTPRQADELLGLQPRNEHRERRCTCARPQVECDGDCDYTTGDK